MILQHGGFIIARRQRELAVEALGGHLVAAAAVLAATEKRDRFQVVYQPLWYLTDPQLFPLVQHPASLSCDLTPVSTGWTRRPLAICLAGNFVGPVQEEVPLAQVVDDLVHSVLQLLNCYQVSIGDLTRRGAEKLSTSGCSGGPGQVLLTCTDSRSFQSIPFLTGILDKTSNPEGGAGVKSTLNPCRRVA